MLPANTADNIITSLKLPDDTYEVLNWKSAASIIENWKQHFASQVRIKHRKWIYSNYLWHAFSRGDSPHLSGTRATEKFNDENTASFYLATLSHDQAPLVIEVTECNLPAIDAICDTVVQFLGTGDLYIIASDFQWTFVFTHEEAFGPYYSSK